ncbi:hypothetical protein [Verrucomicrobium spinosum]|uniref:hypothetical protein n=1 Tax=Verrucomicrobium spinosum TaxID=2736 RepID=UPI000B08F3C7|nr:hypothetical protein [Verrucomicrobium spinosum]
MGGSGLWRPLGFLSGNTLGLYFTEPYDPGRIPVVFVYGIGGGPRTGVISLITLTANATSSGTFTTPAACAWTACPGY